MKMPASIRRFAIAMTVSSAFALPAFAAAPLLAVEGDWVAHDFRFHTGEVMPALKLHYTTVGAKTGEPVLILHGTAGTGAGMLNPAFANELFGPGQPLDASRHYIILPDAIGTGQSAKPSDGLRAKFPRYDYDDIVLAQYRLVTEGLGLKHLRLVLGNSMGGMHAWLWAEQHPGFMDAVVPMASQPTAMSGRNWMTRRMLVDSVRSDPDYKDGNYTTQPQAVRYAAAFFNITTIGGSQGWQKLAPTREAADQLVAQRMAAPFTMDANDFVYQWDASRDYDASRTLELIAAPLLAINAADDERNPPELGVMERELKRVKNGRLYLIPASEDTRGHGTTGMSVFWAPQLDAFMKTVPKRP